LADSVLGKTKKLAEAARLWAGGKPDHVQTSLVTVDDDMIASIKASGAPPEVIAEWEAARTPPPPDFEVHEDNWQVFMLFTQRLASQWEIAAGFAGVIRVGIPLPRIESLFNLLSIPPESRMQMLDDIQLMEASALAVFNNAES